MTTPHKKKHRLDWSVVGGWFLAAAFIYIGVVATLDPVDYSSSRVLPTPAYIRTPIQVGYIAEQKWNRFPRVSDTRIIIPITFVNTSSIAMERTIHLGNTKLFETRSRTRYHHRNYPRYGRLESCYLLNTDPNIPEYQREDACNGKSRLRHTVFIPSQSTTTHYIEFVGKNGQEPLDSEYELHLRESIDGFSMNNYFSLEVNGLKDCRNYPIEKIDLCIAEYEAVQTE